MEQVFKLSIPPNLHLIQENAYQVRKQFVDIQQVSLPSELSIIVICYNNLEKTQNCINSILENTKHFDFELILMDNGSDDGTIDYLNHIPYPKKRIIASPQNIGLDFLLAHITPDMLGRYVVKICNDVIVTPRWLDNLFACLNSDEKIGLVTPMFSNAMGLQGINLCSAGADYAAVQAAGEEYNHSDPRKWQERLILVDPLAFYRKEALLAAGFPIFDVAYLHGNESDLAFRIRRNGYKIILAGDTWVQHDHDYAQPNEGRQSSGLGISANDPNYAINTFSNRWDGVKLFDDVYNFWSNYCKSMPISEGLNLFRILGIDVKCGQPILDIKNYLRQGGKTDVLCYAFTQEERYMPDLRTVCGPENAYCDREEFFRDYFPAEIFDCVVIDRPINQYKEPIKVYRDVLACLKKGGILLLSLLNTQTYVDFLSMAVDKGTASNISAVYLPVERFASAIINDVEILNVFSQIDTLEPQELLMHALDGLCKPEQHQELVTRMLSKKYIFMLKKKQKG